MVFWGRNIDKSTHYQANRLGIVGSSLYAHTYEKSLEIINVFIYLLWICQTQAICICYVKLLAVYKFTNKVVYFL